MSKIFIIKCKKSEKLIAAKGDIAAMCRFYGLDIFVDEDYDEPAFVDVNRNDTILLSLADSAVCNNCDMLMLPDDCSINGQKNADPFFSRVVVFKEIISKLIDMLDSVELFIGESGTPFFDYNHLLADLGELHSIFIKMNTLQPPNLHITVI